MIATLAFTMVASLLVYQAGRRDAARDPRLTIGLLALTAMAPALGLCLPTISVLPEGTAATAAEASFPWAKCVLAIWAAGFFWQMLKIAAAMIEVREWTRNSHEILRLNGVSIRLSRKLSGPMAVGVRRPVILVPPAWSRWTEDCRKIVLEHELTHHARRDPLWRLLSAFACAVHWYQPFVHWMAGRFVVQSEFACDAAVLKSGIAAKAYANVLCDVAAENTPSPLVAAMAERSSLESRVRRMMSPSTGGTARTPVVVLGLLGLLAACSLAMIGRKPVKPSTVPQEEVELRLSANPFPGNP